MPLHQRADEFGVSSFQADLAKFMESDKVAKAFKSLEGRFIVSVRRVPLDER
jgi:hypothetical protein